MLPRGVATLNRQSLAFIQNIAEILIEFFFAFQVRPKNPEIENREYGLIFFWLSKIFCCWYNLGRKTFSLRFKHLFDLVVVRLIEWMMPRLSSGGRTPLGQLTWCRSIPGPACGACALGARAAPRALAWVSRHPLVTDHVCLLNPRWFFEPVPVFGKFWWPMCVFRC